MQINSATVTDGRWHLASVLQQRRALACKVDGFKETLTGFDAAMNGLMFIGGVPHSVVLRDSFGKLSCLSNAKNFSGCLGDVFIGNASLTRPNILRSHHVNRKAEFACNNEHGSLVSFTDPKAVLIVQIEYVTSSTASIDFQIRTLRQNGFIAKVSLKHLVLSLFLVEGLVKAKLKLNAASHSKVVQAVSSVKEPVADGQWHRITCYVALAAREFTLSIDGETQFRKQFLSNPFSSRGGGYNGVLRISGTLRQHQGIVGCVRDMFVNKKWVPLTNQSSVIESTGVLTGFCRIDDMSRIGNALQPTDSLIGGSLNRERRPSLANEYHTTAYHLNTRVFTDPHVPALSTKPITDTLSKLKTNNIESSIPGSSGKVGRVRADNTSLPYLITIATLIGVFVLLLIFVLGACLRSKRWLCFKESGKERHQNETLTDSVSKSKATERCGENDTRQNYHGQIPVQRDFPSHASVIEDKQVDLLKNVDDYQGKNEPFHSLNEQQARYWRERDAKLLDAQCHQHLEHSPVVKQAYFRHSLPLFHFTATQSPQSQETAIATPQVILDVQEKRVILKKSVVNTGKAIHLKERGTSESRPCKINTETPYRPDIEKKKMSQGAEELPGKKKKRLGFGWAYGSRFARGPDSSDTDCSDVERRVPHSRYTHRYGKNFEKNNTCRPLKILEASETEEDQNSNDEKTNDEPKKERSSFGKSKKFGTFQCKGLEFLNSLPEEEKECDGNNEGERDKTPGVTTGPMSTLGQQGCTIRTEKGVEKDGVWGKPKPLGKSVKCNASEDAIPVHERGDPDGHLEIRHRLSSLLSRDVGSGPKEYQERDKPELPHHASNCFMDDQNYDARSCHRNSTTNQEFGRSAAGHPNIQNCGGETLASPRKAYILGNNQKEMMPGLARQHLKIPKEMLIQRASSLMEPKER